MQALQRFRVAAVQMASGTNVSANLAEAARHIAEAVAHGAQLVALPEFFALMGKRDADILGIRETPGDGPIQTFLSEQASSHDIWLLGGTIPLACEIPDKIRAASILFDSEGRQVARYDKIHLFDVTVEGDSKKDYQESRIIDAGTEVVVLDTPFGRLGLSVCYDLRFPELYRAMAVEGMDLLMLPSAFTAVTGKAHWETLVRARAIENLCYVVAPAQGGYHLNGRETNGDSMIVDPWGSVLSRLTKGSGIVAHEVDRERASDLRRSFPSLQHMRLEITTP